MTEEKTISTLRIYEGRVVNLRVDTVQLPSGRTTRREVAEHPGAVAIVALDTANRLVLVRQYRKAVDRTLLELPAGTLSAGEDPENCARRELQEETGYLPGKLERMGGFYSAPGFCTEYLHLYLATDLVGGSVQPEDDENIEVVCLPFAEARRLAEIGEICDAKSIIGILLYAGRQHGSDA